MVDPEETMSHIYQSITTAAIEAIEAMAREPRDTRLCDSRSLRDIAAGVDWSWADLVGEAARQDDIDKLIRIISGMARSSPRFDDKPFRLSRLT
jgi:hypothetical protein